MIRRPIRNCFRSDAEQEKERDRLFDLIEKLVLWENSNNSDLLEAARVEIEASCGTSIPTVVDPFSGGGSIPLEAQRLGLRVDASDLNPVAVLIGKALVELPPKFSGSEARPPGLAAERQHQIHGTVRRDWPRMSVPTPNG